MQSMEPEMKRAPKGTADGKEDKADAVASFYEWIGAAVFSLIVVVLVFTFLLRIVGWTASPCRRP